MRYLFFIFICLIMCVSNLNANNRITDQKVRQVIQEITKSSKYEKKLSQPLVKKPQKQPASSGRSYSNIGGASNFGQTIGKFFFYIFIVVLIAIVIYYLSNMKWNQKEPIKTVATKISPLQETNTILDEDLAPHEQLFKQGDLIGACRALFKDSLLSIKEKQKIRIRSSDTPREIIRKIKDASTYKMLMPMVTAIEKGYYAKISLSSEDYDVCLNNYQRLQHHRLT